MPKTKISEFSATPANNTDIDSINIAEGCAPSGINDAIRELMAQLKDFQTGAVGDSFNGPIGTSTAAAGAFTTLSASSTTTLSGLTASTALALDASKNVVSVTNTGTGSNVLATSPTLVTPILGTPTSGNFSTGTFTWPTFNQNTTGTAAGLSATLATTSGGTGLTSFTSGGVVYASSTSALATGSALTFDGSTTLIVKTNDATATVAKFRATNYGNLGTTYISLGTQYDDGTSRIGSLNTTGNQSSLVFETNTASSGVWQEGFRLTNTSLYTASGINVGIGLTNPSSYGTRLAVSGAANVYGDERKVVSIIDTTALAAGVGAGISFFGVSESGGGVSQFGSIKGIKENATSANYAGALAFVTSNSANAQTQRMLLDSAGNLGLGVTPSAWRSTNPAFQIAQAGCLFGYSSSVITGLGSNTFINSGGDEKYIVNGTATLYQQNNSGKHIWYNAPSGTAGDTISFTQAMTLDASGNLLIGSTANANSAKLKSKVSGGSVGLEITDEASSDFVVVPASSAGVCKIGPTAGAMSFQTAGTERARITSGGDLYVGTTTGSIGTANFGVVITQAGSVIGSRNENGSVSVFYYGGNAGYAQILGNGNLQNSNGVYAAISDVKLKENIVDASPKLADLMQVKVRNYNLIGDTTKQIGVVAQELETVFPSMIDATFDKDAEGNDLGTTTKSVKYSVFVPMLIKAMQELKAEFDAYKASHP